ncbi:hypothetical protein GGX14DRAFT_696667 [Mycena pura]|uniref:Uncharacterized protein n=1 Tax=Mycena pura TaxID=153505 RepID=A0AAD6VJE3_9AGAR|nr:hypothetical protein GGX14DRAFT_696667 [Mycena pura]
MHEDAYKYKVESCFFYLPPMNSSFESSILPPCYSQDPAHDETRLELSSSRTTRQLPTDIFTKACGSATVVLFNQEPGVRVPLYGRERCVRGTLILAQDTGNICRVVAKLQGRLEMATSDAGASTTKTVNKEYPLWPHGSESSSSPCPGTLEFACDFPAMFQHGNSEYRLPPSYIARFPGFPSLYVKSTYNLAIVITRDRRLGFLSRTKLIYIALEYRPESYPPRGISAAPYGDFNSALKTMPEEWQQSSFTMTARSPSLVSPIQCQVFIPSIGIFGLKDSIPLHLQLSGALASLRELVVPPRARSRPAVASPDRSAEARAHEPVRVYLTRMVTVNHLDKLTMRVQRLCAADVAPLPPAVDFECSCQQPYEDCATCTETVTETLDWAGYVPADVAPLPPPVDCECSCPFQQPCEECATRTETLNWAGYVRCDPGAGVDVGGFRAAGVNVKDFITVELSPPRPHASPLLVVRQAIPIRFVTETFVERDY